MGCCSSAKKGNKQEREKVLREGSQLIVQMQKQIKEMLEANLEYGKKISELRNQMQKLNGMLDEKSAKIVTQATTFEKYQVSDQEEIAQVQREIRELKQQTDLTEEKFSKNEITLQQVQLQLENVANRAGGGVGNGNSQNQQSNNVQLEQRVYNNERNLQVHEQEMNKKIENISSQTNKVQTANIINKKDVDNLLEIVQTQQQLIQEEVSKQKLLNQQVSEIEQQLKMSKEFQLIQQFQIEKLSKMIVEQRNTSQLQDSGRGRSNENNGLSLQECILTQKQRHLNDLNLIHKQHGFSWKSWRELEEYKWVLTQDNKFAHEFEVKQNSGAAAEQPNMKQKIICNICYTQYISMNKVFTQLQLNSEINKNC